MTPDLRAELLQFYSDPNAPYATKRKPKEWAKLQAALQQLKIAGHTRDCRGFAPYREQSPVAAVSETAGFRFNNTKAHPNPVVADLQIGHRKQRVNVTTPRHCSRIPVHPTPAPNPHEFCFSAESNKLLLRCRRGRETMSVSRRSLIAPE